MRKKMEKVIIDEEEMDERTKYAADVANYMKWHRKEFIEKFAKLCQKTSGRISYDDMRIALGKDFPKASWISKNDIREQIIQFFVQLGFYYGHDDEYLYFP